MLKEFKEGRPVILETHPHYRTAIGVLGASLPVILIGASLIGLLDTPELQTSISAYYWTSMRDWFVGTLFVIGVFLFFYTYTPHNHGSDARTKYDVVRKGKADAWLGKIAGVAAVLVALLPTNPPPSTVQPPTIGTLHGVAAAALFTCLALFPLLLFSQSKKKERVYQIYGWAMLATLAAIVGYQFAPETFRTALAPAKPVLFLETFLIFVFGKSWFDKGRELAELQANPADVKSRPLAGVTAGLFVIAASVLTAPVLAQQPAPPATAKPALLTAADQELTAGDVTLRYRDAGTGDPVILIHGYSAALESMAGIAAALPQYRTVALDVRGFGKSSKFAEPARFGQSIVDDVTRLMDHLKITRAHVLGHSMGALIAANVAARYPDRVTTATLVAGPFYPDEATFTRETERWVTDLESGAGLKNFMLWLFPAFKPQMADIINAQALKTNDVPSLIAVMKSLPKLTIAGLPKNGEQALLIAGTGDPLFPLSPAFAKQSPGSRIVEIAGADHVAVILNPAAVTAIREQLQR